MVLENVKVEAYSIRRKKGDYFPATVRVHMEDESGLVATMMASSKYKKRPKKLAERDGSGDVAEFSSIETSEYIAKEGKFAGKTMHSIDSFTK